MCSPSKDDDNGYNDIKNNNSNNLDCFPLEDGDNILSQIAGNRLSIYAAKILEERRSLQQQQQHKPQDLKYYDFGQFRILFGVLKNMPLRASF